MPAYGGNGVKCGLDSDSDGYPDVQLNCPDQSCQQVNNLNRKPLQYYLTRLQWLLLK